MSNTNDKPSPLEVEINGRSAIPVRAIPWISSEVWDLAWVVDILSGKENGLIGTGENCSPEVKRLLERQGTDQRRLLKPYILQSGKYRFMRPQEWKMIADEIETLTEVMKAKDTVWNEGKTSWKYQALCLIPPAAFVWRDKLVSAFSSHGEAYDFVDLDGGNEEGPIYPTPAFSPHIPQPSQGAVMEAVDVLRSGGEKFDPPRNDLDPDDAKLGAIIRQQRSMFVQRGVAEARASAEERWESAVKYARILMKKRPSLSKQEAARRTLLDFEKEDAPLPGKAGTLRRKL